MTQDEIIEMAVQAGMAKEIAEVNIDIVKAFAKLVEEQVTAKEREAIIQIIKTTPFSNWFQADLIEAIRARGQA